MAKHEEGEVKARRQFVSRLYGEPAMFGIARLVGYSGIHERELNLELRGVELPRSAQVTLEQAMAEITLKGVDGTVRLTEQARRCCRVLLGPAPESGEREAWLSLRGGLPGKDEAPAKKTGSRPKDKRGRKEEAKEKVKRGKAEDGGGRAGGSGNEEVAGDADAGRVRVGGTRGVGKVKGRGAGGSPRSPRRKP